MSEMNGKGNGQASLNILLVDDNDADVKIALRAFQHAKLKNNIVHVHDGLECLQYMKKEGPYADQENFPAPDIILLDISMPRVDGFGVLKELKGEGSSCLIPVVILTASKNAEDIRKCFELGASSFITKPVSYEEFVKVIDNFNQYWQVLNKLPTRC